MEDMGVPVPGIRELTAAWTGAKFPGDTVSKSVCFTAVAGEGCSNLRKRTEESRRSTFGSPKGLRFSARALPFLNSPSAI